MEGRVSRATLDALLAGVELDDGPATVSAAALVGEGARDKSIVELVIHQGRNRIVRRLLDHAGHPVRQPDPHRDRPGPAGRDEERRAPRAHGDELGSLLDAAKL